jgi:hypothetical protein
MTGGNGTSLDRGVWAWDKPAVPNVKSKAKNRIRGSMDASSQLTSRPSLRPAIVNARRPERRRSPDATIVKCRFLT